MDLLLVSSRCLLYILEVAKIQCLRWFVHFYVAMSSYVGLSNNGEGLWYFIVLRLQPFWSNECSIYCPGTYFSQFCGGMVNLSIAYI